MKLELFYVVKQLSTEPHPNPRIRYVSGPYASFANAFSVMTEQYPGDESYIIVSSIEEVA
jgi:hypothetical protein